MNQCLYPCAFCDTELPQDEKRVTLTLQRHDRWYIFENVPARVCPNCGHRYFDGPLLLELEKLTQHPEKGREVSAYAFSLPLST
jgi:YgiT-type zinc finger domain-containing protein